MKTALIYDQTGIIVVCATFDEDGAEHKANAFGEANAAGRPWMVINGALEGPASSYRVADGEIVPASQQAIVDRQWASVRYERFTLLSESDWRVTRATETGVPMSAEWVAYRQALRDVTAQPDPFNIVWPTPPA